MKLEIPYKQKTSSEKILENKKGRDGKKVKKKGVMSTIIMIK